MVWALSFRSWKSCAKAELIHFAGRKGTLKHLGKGFARSSRPDDVAEAVAFLEPDAECGQATHLIFAREIRRAIAEHLKTDSPPHRKPER